MPKLISLYIRQVAIGFVLSAVFVGLLMYFNVANLWHLVSNSSEGLIALTVMWVLNGIVFAGVQFGIAIMCMKEDDHSGGKRQMMPVMLAEPVPVRVARKAEQR